VDDDSGTYSFGELKVTSISAIDELQDYIHDGGGSLTTYTLKSEDEVFTLNQYSWPEDAELFVESKTVSGSQTGMMTESGLSSDPVNIQSAEFGNLSFAGTDDPSGAQENVSMLLDVELEIRVEIDRKQILVSDLLKLGKGSIVEMDKSAGEPLDVFVNGRKFAEGEVVVVDDRFGIRITQLLSPKDRVKSLGKQF